MSITSEIRLRIKKEGDVALTQLSAKLNDVASRSVVSNKKFKDLAATLKQNDAQIKGKSINALNDYARAWRELANSVDVTSKEFRQATQEAQRFERESAKAQGRRGGGRLMGIAKGAGAIASGGIFGGPEGALGAGLGLAFGGPAGAVVGGAIGAYAKSLREALGEIASFSAAVRRQEIALQGVVGSSQEYDFAIKSIKNATKDFAIPTSVLTREFTKLQASVQGAGGNVQDTEKTFRAIVSSIRATGGSIEDVRSALTATAQVFSKGKVSAEELRQQIGERLPGAFTLFAESIGKTPAELDKALEKGEVSLQDFMSFTELLLQRYEENAKKLASGPEAAGDRLTVVLENLKKTTGPILADIGASFQSFSAEAVTALDNAIRKLGEFGRKVEEAIGGKTIENARKNIERQTKIIERLEGRVKAGLELTAEEQRQLDIAIALRAGSLKVVQGDAPSAPSKPSKLPGTPPKDLATKGRKDISPALRAAREAAAAEMAPFKKLELDYAAKKLSIEESNLKVNEKAARLAELKRKHEDKLAKLGERYGNIMSAALFKNGEITRQQEIQIQNLEIQAGIIDEKEARELERAQFIQELRKDGNDVTQEQLDRINKAFDEINAKTSESALLMKEIGRTVATSLGDAFMSLIDNAKSLRDILSDILNQVARLLVQAGTKALLSTIPGLGAFFATGGIMSNDGAFPLKRYARGGVANSPQLAMFGEGSTPEAYVPLPDGRTIPVTIRNGKDGGGVSVNVNVDAAGSEVAGNNDQAGHLGKAIGVAVQQELIKQKRPGGLLSGV